jgi:hypothetical protein
VEDVEDQLRSEEGILAEALEDLAMAVTVEEDILEVLVQEGILEVLEDEEPGNEIPFRNSLSSSTIRSRRVMDSLMTASMEELHGRSLCLTI